MRNGRLLVRIGGAKMPLQAINSLFVDILMVEAV
jgi:hypothetical protein